MKNLMITWLFVLGIVQSGMAVEPAGMDSSSNVQDKYSPGSPLPSTSGDNPSHGYSSDDGYSNIPESYSAPRSDSGYTDYGDPSNPRPLSQ